MIPIPGLVVTKGTIFIRIKADKTGVFPPDLNLC